jgi:signal transduction histidine kinase/ActR/RegA family two-component response regulator
MARPGSVGLAALVPGIVVAGVCLTAGAAALLAFHFGRAGAIEGRLEHLRNLADGYATAVHFYLDGARASVETSAQLPRMREAIVAAAGGEPLARAEALAAARMVASVILRSSRVFDDVMLLDAQGAVLLLEPASLEASQSRPDRAFTPWHRELTRTGRTVFSDLQLSASTLRPTVVVASPVRDAAGRVLGAWAGSLGLAELSRVGQPGDRVRAEYGFLTDRRGLIIAHQAQTRYVQHQTDFSAVPSVQAGLRGQRGAGRYDNPIERLDQLGAWVPLPETGWAIVYEWPAEAALAPIRALAGTILALATAIATGLGLAGWLVARRVVRPLEQLTETAERLPSGAFRFEVEGAPGVEVGRLASALNRMVVALQEKDAGLRQRAEELQSLVTDLEAAGRIKDEFLATLSHELRTPLNAVYGWARMIQMQQLDEAGQERAIDAIVRNANAQVQLVDDLLDVSRIITGKMRLDVRPVDLTAVINAALDASRPAAQAKGLRLQAVLDPRAGSIVGDPNRLQQVVWNLLTNSVKFTERGGRIQVHLQRVDSHVEIVVSDSGQGIAPELLSVIFDRFRQGDSSSTRPHSGLGLGLALVRHLVELHGGTVDARSPGDGQGATFVVRLPTSLARVEEPASSRAYPTAGVDLPAHTGPALDGLRVLVIDDEPDALALAATILTSARAKVMTCASASEAIPRLDDFHPDVLLVDVEMPVEDGYSLIRKIRARDPARGGKTPAVALTAYGRSEDRMRALSAGFNMHVPKPVEPAELIAVVAGLAELDTARHIAPPASDAAPGTGRVP